MFTRGIELLANGNREDALDEFRESLTDAVGDQKADSLYNIAICYIKLGNIDAALQAVSEALRIDPDLADEMKTDDFVPLASSESFREALRSVGNDVGTHDQRHTQATGPSKLAAGSLDLSPLSAAVNVPATTAVASHEPKSWRAVSLAPSSSPHSLKTITRCTCLGTRRS